MKYNLDKVTLWSIQTCYIFQDDLKVLKEKDIKYMVELSNEYFKQDLDYTQLEKKELKSIYLALKSTYEYLKSIDLSTFEIPRFSPLIVEVSDLWNEESEPYERPM